MKRDTREWLLGMRCFSNVKILALGCAVDEGYLFSAGVWGRFSPTVRDWLTFKNGWVAPVKKSVLKGAGLMDELWKTFVERFTELDALKLPVREVEARFTEELQRVYTWTFPKCKPKVYDSESQRKHVLRRALGAEAEFIFSKYKNYADKLWTTYDTKKKRLEKELDALSDLIPMAPESERVADQAQWFDFYSSSSDSYRSQGFGAERYARQSAENSADLPKSRGIPCKIVTSYQKDEHGYVWNTTWTVKVALTKVGCVWLIRQKTSLRDWVKACWARGVNPRVYDPFLPVDFEEKANLDYFGGDRVGVFAVKQEKNSGEEI